MLIRYDFREKKRGKFYVSIFDDILYCVFSCCLFSKDFILGEDRLFLIKEKNLLNIFVFSF